jgi:hypothetical protein
MNELLIDDLSIPGLRLSLKPEPNGICALEIETDAGRCLGVDLDADAAEDVRKWLCEWLDVDCERRRNR